VGLKGMLGGGEFMQFGKFFWAIGLGAVFVSSTAGDL